MLHYLLQAYKLSSKSDLYKLAIKLKRKKHGMLSHGVHQNVSVHSVNIVHNVVAIYDIIQNIAGNTARCFPHSLYFQ